MKLDVGALDARDGVLAVGLDGGEGLGPGALWVGLLAQHGPEQVVQRLYQSPVSAVRGHQGPALAAARSHDALSLGAEDGHIGPPEAVDRLLGVPDDEELPR